MAKFNILSGSFRSGVCQVCAIRESRIMYGNVIFTVAAYLAQRAKTLHASKWMIDTTTRSTRSYKGKVKDYYQDYYQEIAPSELRAVQT